VSKFSRSPARQAVSSPVKTVARVTVTHEGAQAFARDAKSDLFLLAVTNMAGEDTFYEGASDRDARFRALVHQVTAEDPGWVARFVPYLRGEMNMRSASIVMAAESAHARLAGSIDAQPTVRQLVASSISRADEPAEFIAYWAQRYGRRLPAAVKRGVSDAMRRVVNEYTAMKYDGVGRAWRLGDVIEMVHAKPDGQAQSALYAYLLDRRHNPGDIRADLSALPLVKFRQWLESVPPAERRNVLRSIGHGPEGALGLAGATWEWLSGWLPGGMDAEAWSWVIPSMGYMGLLRNLRNFDRSGVPDRVAEKVAARLADPEQVAKSRQFPFRFWSAYAAAPSLRWGYALEQALDASTSNIPDLPGRTLVLCDTSGSMTGRAISARSTVTPAVGAALFGVALARRCRTVDLVGFGTGTFVHELLPGGSTLPQVKAFASRFGEVGHGTNIPAAMRHWSGHDRVFLLSDMQTSSFYGTAAAIPASVPVYAFNLAGYDRAYVESGQGNVHEFGGMSDRTFTMISMLERGTSTSWPF
jgi:hypothetical protein